jgi:hypothetical protein
VGRYRAQLPYVRRVRRRWQHSLPGPGTGRLYKDGAGFVRHWDAWETPGNYSRVFAFALGADGRIDTDSGRALDGDPAQGGLVGDAPTKPFGDGGEIAWSADGRAVIYAARQADRNEPHSTNIDLWWAPVDGSAPKNLTAANTATDTMPAVSPDGKWLAYAAMARPGYESDRLVVHLRNLATGEDRALTEGWDRSVASLTWTPDGKALIATAEDVLDTPAFRIDAASGKVARLALSPDKAREGHISNVLPLKDGRVVFLRDTIDAPAELYVAKAGKPGLRVTDVAATTMAERAPVVTRRLSFTGANGDTVWGWVTKPAGTTGKLPAILYVHGGPQGSFNDGWSNRWNARVVASQGYAVVAIDFHGSTGYGQAFVDAINRDWGGKPLEDLQKGLAAAAAADPQDRRWQRLRDGRILWRIHDELDRGPVARQVQVHRPARWRVRRACHGLRNRGAVVRRMGTRRTRLLRGARGVREVEPGEPRGQVEDADAGGDEREGLPHSLYPGPCRLHRVADAQGPVRTAGLPRREPLGAQGEEFTAMA